jgi:hypothetical protein
MVTREEWFKICAVEGIVYSEADKAFLQSLDGLEPEEARRRIREHSKRLEKD